MATAETAEKEGIGDHRMNVGTGERGLAQEARDTRTDKTAGIMTGVVKAEEDTEKTVVKKEARIAAEEEVVTETGKKGIEIYLIL